MFDKAQVMEFKDAFSIMDTNSDGLVDVNDLKITFERLGAWTVQHCFSQTKVITNLFYVRSACYNTRDWSYDGRCDRTYQLYSIPDVNGRKINGYGSRKYNFEGIFSIWW